MLGFKNKHADALAPVLPQILLAGWMKWDGSLEEGQVSTDGALSLSLCLPFSPTDGPNHTYSSHACPVATQPVKKCTNVCVYVCTPMTLLSHKRDALCIGFLTLHEGERLSPAALRIWCLTCEWKAKL